MEATSLAAESQQRSLWASLAEAIRGSHQDYTAGSLNRAILLLAVPMVLEMVLESLFAVVDGFWVGRLGANAVATVGLTESMLRLVFAVGMGLSLSTTAIVARRIGRKHAAGAAAATLIGRSIGVLYQFYRLLKGTERIRILTSQIHLQWDVLLRLLRVSVTGILQFAIAHTSWIGLVRIISIFGAAALAGYTIAIRIVLFLILPSCGLINAPAPLLSQNLGARTPHRSEKALWRAGLYSGIFLVA